jgi:O-antigen ligase
VFSIFAFAMGLTAIVLSSARGAWVTLVIGSLIYIILIFKQGLVNNNNNKIIIVLFITTLVGISSTIDGVRDRTSLAYLQYNQWISGAVGSTKSSVGTRLEMYRAGLKAVPDTPLFGHGYRQANVVASHYASKESQKHIASFNHLHNAYLSMFLYSGIFGLLSLLLLFYAPLRLFIKNIGNRNLTYEVNMGIMLTFSIAASGLTSVTFGDANINGIYLLFLAYLLPVVVKKSAL